MLIFRVLLPIVAVSAAPETSVRQHQPLRFEELILEVQDAFRRIVTHRSSKMHERMVNMCRDKELMTMKVNIVKGSAPNASAYENYVHWNDEECIMHVYDAGVEILQKWCIEEPDRHLTYQHNASESAVKGPQLAVTANCQLFAVDPIEYYRDFAESIFKLCFIVATLVFVFIMFSCFFRRDVVVVVGKVGEKAKDIEQEVLEKKDAWKQNSPDADCLVLLDNQ